VKIYRDEVFILADNILQESVLPSLVSSLVNLRNTVCDIRIRGFIFVYLFLLCGLSKDYTCNTCI
jgi:hypothetical protein